MENRRYWRVNVNSTLIQHVLSAGITEQNWV